MSLSLCPSLFLSAHVGIPTPALVFVVDPAPVPGAGDVAVVLLMWQPTGNTCPTEPALPFSAMVFLLLPI